MPFLTDVMISMSASGTGVFDEGASPGWVAGGQQPAPGSLSCNYCSSAWIENGKKENGQSRRTGL